jgi:hypothetical protein
MSLVKFWKILVVKVHEAWQQTSRYNCESHGSWRDPSFAHRGNAFWYADEEGSKVDEFSKFWWVGRKVKPEVAEGTSLPMC